jgi:rhodanese-related sulfurtransferase
VTERRTSALDAALARARARYGRLTPARAWAALQDGALLVDTRPGDQRQRDGEVPGAVVVGRNVLEWRLDPVGVWRMPEATGPEQQVVLLCDEGCSTQLAVVSLLDLGLVRATDVAGGMQAWLADGLPTVPPGTCIDRTPPPPVEPGLSGRQDRL